MNWNNNRPTKQDWLNHKERWKKKFLLLPRSINNRTYWLETVIVVERVARVPVMDFGIRESWEDNYHYKWREVEGIVKVATK